MSTADSKAVTILEWDGQDILFESDDWCIWRDTYYVEYADGSFEVAAPAESFGGGPKLYQHNYSAEPEWAETKPDDPRVPPAVRAEFKRVRRAA